MPHVVTIAAVNAQERPAPFVVAADAVDLAAPGEGVLAAVPLRFDGDGNADGYRHVSGTSFPAAMAAAAAAWLLAEDPSLTPDQVAHMLRRSARDLDQPGHDPLTGWGMLRVGAALEIDPPAPDPREPNDDIPSVNGQHLPPAQRSLWSGGPARTIVARLDRFEDPADVYPVRLPGRARIRIRVTPRTGDPSLEAYAHGARGIGHRRQRLGRSQREGSRSESLVLRSRYRRSRWIYLHTSINPDQQRRDASYALTIALATPRR